MVSKIIIAWSFFVIALSIGYYFVIFLPTKERLANELKQQQIEDQQILDRKHFEQLQACIDTANENTRARWDLNCLDYGKDKKEAGCTLPGAIADVFTKENTDAQELCIKKYK